MYSLAKDLLFLHGYITRPEDLDPAARQEPATPERAAAAPARKDAVPVGNVECGAC